MDKLKLAEVTPSATASPIPSLEINPKAAPGLKGPRGLSPKTNYSRVNSGMPPQPDAGASAQKALSPMGASSLPKLAGEIMGTFKTPTLQEMVKAAMAGATQRVAASLGAEKFSKTAGESCKECGKDDCKCEKTASVSTEYAEKFASAIEYILPQLKEASVEVGSGPGALQVTQATSEGTLPETHGQASVQPPKNPGLQKATPAGPATQLENNMGKAPGGPGTMVEKNAQRLAAVLGKTAAKEETEKAESDGLAEAEKGLAKAEAAHLKENTKGEKKASLADFLRAQVKQAEDAINPAKITAGAAVPPDTSASGEAGGSPAGGSPQGPTGLVSSNEAATNANQSQALANRKADMKKYLNEPMHGNDTTLKDVLVHSSAADGNKFASAQEASVKTAAARALLAKLAEAEMAKKEKSNGAKS